MKRGELYRVQEPGRGDPKRLRTFAVVSRQALIDSKFSSVICAPVYSRGTGMATQVMVGLEEGTKHESWIWCDALISIDKVRLTSYIGSLPAEKVRQIDRALKAALALDGGSFLIQ